MRFSDRHFAIPAAISTVAGVGIDMVGNSLDHFWPDAPHWLWNAIFVLGTVMMMAFPLWAAGCFLSWLFVRWRTIAGERRRRADSYLSDLDSELGSAIRQMVWRSAWAKWYAAQCLVSDRHEPIDEDSHMQTGASLVTSAAMDGELAVRGRQPGAIEYEPISRDAWRLVAIHMVRHPASLWKAIIITRTGVDSDRVRRILDYDSLIVDSNDFQRLWPRRNAETDKARRMLL
jgi:hypothetical protein